MPSIDRTTFVCLDCESTGLDCKYDSIIEIALAVFKNWSIIETFQSLVNPKVQIPGESIKIHGITNEMVANETTLDKILEQILHIADKGVLVGHNVSFDISIIQESSKKLGRNWSPKHQPIDTLRLARLYGQSPVNSLSALCSHFNIPMHYSHRAMNDVYGTTKLFKMLSKPFKTVEDIHKRLTKPIEMKNMPLGKHKGCPIRDLPSDYLGWAINKKFDQDLLFSLTKEAKRRKGAHFEQGGNPFQKL